MADKLDEQNAPNAEQALVGVWLEKIKHFQKKNKDFEKECKTNRQRQYGKGKGGKKYRTNLIFATMAALLPRIYAKNPDVSITPREIVARDQYEPVKKFGKTAEIVLSQKLIKEGKLKDNFKANVRSTMVTSVGWLKLVYQKSFKRDPLIQKRIEDAQDNLARIERLIEDAEDPTNTDHEAAAEQLRIDLAALEASPEIPVYQGFVLDRVRSEDILILDDSIEEFHQYPDAEAIAHRIWFTKERYEETFGRCPSESATKFRQRASEADGTEDKDAPQVDHYAVWEVWHRRSNTVYTVCEGMNQWVRAPYQPKNLARRWYPFYCLGFNVVEGRFLPMSDVELITELQEEYESTRQAFTEHRKDSLPVRLYRENGNLTEEDVKRIANRKSRDLIGVEGTPGQALGNDIAQYQNIPIDPMVYDVTPVRNDMDIVSGMSDASRSNLIQPKTATEAEIMEQGMSSRVDERRDVAEDLLTEMFTGALEILLEELTPEQVMTIAGQDAVWPELSREEIFAMVSLVIRAGSTTKPNKMRERETWVQLLPQIQQTMQTVAELRQTGQVDMAEAAINLLRETLTRFDEHIDLDMFVPQQDEDNEITQLVQQLQEAQAQLEQLTAEVEELRQAADKNAAAIEQERIKEDGLTKRHAMTLEFEGSKAVLEGDTTLEGKRMDNDAKLAGEAIRGAQRPEPATQQ